MVIKDSIPDHQLVHRVLTLRHIWQKHKEKDRTLEYIGPLKGNSVLGKGKRIFSMARNLPLPQTS